MVDGGQVGFAGLLGWRTNADKDRLPGANGFTGIGGVRNAPGFACGNEDFFEMLFVNRHAAGIELGDALGVNVCADDFVACLSEASPGDQSNVSTSDDGKTQEEPSLLGLRAEAP